TTCAAAWVEWERDVVGVPTAPKDAGATPRDAGNTPRDAGTTSAGVSNATGGCSLSKSVDGSDEPSRPSTPSRDAWALGVILLGASVRRSRKPTMRLKR
ncbi:MAG TPA: hypothetical protein VHU80_09350, partial [Polyangiaceae bacterium]|nr:hypothetical protein [Polyangiaceae bacterium]